MTNNNGNSKSNIGTLLFGMLLGVSAAIMLDKDSRKKTKKKIMSTLDRGDEALDNLHEKAKDSANKARSQAQKVKNTAQRKLSEKLEETQQNMRK